MSHFNPLLDKTGQRNDLVRVSHFAVNPVLVFCLCPIWREPSFCQPCSNLIHDRSLTLQWRHNERDGVWNHRRSDCLLNRLFRRTPKKTSKLCVIYFWEGNPPPVTDGFPSQSSGNAQKVSIGWRVNSLRSYAFSVYSLRPSDAYMRQ